MRSGKEGQRSRTGEPADPCSVSPQVNREIVSGMKYIQHTYRKGVKSKWVDCGVGSLWVWGEACIAMTLSFLPCS